MSEQEKKETVGGGIVLTIVMLCAFGVAAMIHWALT